MTVKKTYRLSEEAVQILREYAQQNSLSDTQALERILKEHRQAGDDLAGTLAERVMQRFNEEYESILKKGILLSCRFADKNAQVLIELMNSLLVHLEAEQFCSTKTIPSSVYLDAVRQVEDEITANRIHALAKKNKGNL